MLPSNRVVPHPGELLQRLFLNEMHITQKDLGEHTKMGQKRVNEICTGKRGVTAESAWLLAQALGTTPEFWMNLQAAHELTKARPETVIEPMAQAVAG